jgi:hypothetical protein
MNLREYTELWNKFFENRKSNKKTCNLCGHSLKNNNHGGDQNDFYINENNELIYRGKCTYCKICREEYLKENK